MRLLCPLTPVCVELPGKQSSSSPVSGFPATESYGGIQQNCIFLWRRQQKHKHWGLLWYLCWVHWQIWGEQEKCIYYTSPAVLLLQCYSKNYRHIPLCSSFSAFHQTIQHNCLKKLHISSNSSWWTTFINFYQQLQINTSYDYLITS